MSGQFETGVIAAVWRYRVMVFVIVALATLASFAVGNRTQAVTTATATIGLRTPRSDNVIAPGLQGDASLGRYTAQRARFVTSDAVLSTVADSLGVDNLTTLRRHVRAVPSATSNIVTVTAEANSTDVAVALAQAVVSAYATETLRQVEDTTNAAVAAINEQLGDLDTTAATSSATAIQLQLQIADLQSSRAEFGDGVEFVVEPTAESAIVPGLPIKDLLVGFVVGLGIAGGLAWLRAEKDRRVESPEHAEALLDRPLLARLDDGSGKVPLKPGDQFVLPTHDFRLLWTGLSRNVASGAILVQAIGPATSSAAVVNLAAAAAREGFRVLVVDANVRVGSMSAMLGVPPATDGLTDLLRGEGEWRHRLVPVQLPTNHQFSLLAAGPAAEEIDVSLARLEDYVGKWRSEFDYVLIDCDRPGHGQLASKLASVADGVLLIVGRGVKETDVTWAARSAEVQGATLVGFAFAKAWRSAAQAIGSVSVAKNRPVKSIKKR